MAILKKNVFTIIELGSSKIVCVIFYLSFNEIKIVGVGVEIARGIKSGVISDAKDAISSISSAIKKAERNYGRMIEDIYVIINGADIRSEIILHEVSVNGKDITERDIKNLINRAVDNLKYNDERVILHSINNGYALDGICVSNPIGMCAKKIELSINFISALRIPLININQIFAQCRVNIKSYIAAPYADSFSCLSDDDKNIGATVINLGAQNTSVITFKNGFLTSSYSKPIGSSYITLDIAYAFGNSIADAERMKLLYGNLFIDEDNNEKISLKVDGHSDEVFVYKNEFLSVILARQEEIIESILQKNDNFCYSISERKIIITGGGSGINGIINLFEQFFPCKLIKNLETSYIDSIDNEFKDFNQDDPLYSTIFGGIKYLHQLLKDQFRNEKNDHFINLSQFSKLFRWMKKSIKI